MGAKCSQISLIAVDCQQRAQSLITVKLSLMTVKLSLMTVKLNDLPLTFLICY